MAGMFSCQLCVCNKGVMQCHCICTCICLVLQIAGSVSVVGVVLIRNALGGEGLGIVLHGKRDLVAVLVLDARDSKGTLAECAMR